MTVYGFSKRETARNLSIIARERPPMLRGVPAEQVPVRSWYAKVPNGVPAFDDTTDPTMGSADDCEIYYEDETGKLTRLTDEKEVDVTLQCWNIERRAIPANTWARVLQIGQLPVLIPTTYGIATHVEGTVWVSPDETEVGGTLETTIEVNRFWDGTDPGSTANIQLYVRDLPARRTAYFITASWSPEKQKYMGWVPLVTRAENCALNCECDNYSNPEECETPEPACEGDNPEGSYLRLTLSGFADCSHVNMDCANSQTIPWSTLNGSYDFNPPPDFDGTAGTGGIDQTFDFGIYACNGGFGCGANLTIRVVGTFRCVSEKLNFSVSGLEIAAVVADISGCVLQAGDPGCSGQTFHGAGACCDAGNPTGAVADWGLEIV